MTGFLNANDVSSRKWRPCSPLLLIRSRHVTYAQPTYHLYAASTIRSRQRPRYAAIISPIRSCSSTTSTTSTTSTLFLVAPPIFNFTCVMYGQAIQIGDWPILRKAGSFARITYTRTCVNLHILYFPGKILMILRHCHSTFVSTENLINGPIYLERKSKIYPVVQMCAESCLRKILQCESLFPFMSHCILKIAIPLPV